MKRKLKVNDFFCGCGGMGIAFKNAGYEIAGAWDFDKYAVESYRANVGDHVQKADIKELHQADIHPYNGIENITSVARLSYTPRQQRTT